MANRGEFTGLNLGLLSVPQGQWVGLNLGVEWDVDPPEPVVRGLRSVTTVSWQGAAGRRVACRVDWSSGAALAPQYRMPWQGQPQLKRVASLDWGGAHLRRSVLGLRWIQSMAGARMGAVVRWGALPLERSACQLVWRDQVVARQGTRVHLGWRAPAPPRSLPAELVRRAGSDPLRLKRAVGESRAGPLGPRASMGAGATHPVVGPPTEAHSP